MQLSFNLKIALATNIFAPVFLEFLRITHLFLLNHETLLEEFFFLPNVVCHGDARG
jgi:hypothetical protein